MCFSLSKTIHTLAARFNLCPNHADATKITLAPSNADINQGENVTLQCHASHDPTMDLTFTWALKGVLLDLEDSAGPYHRLEGVSPVMPAGERMVGMIPYV